MRARVLVLFLFQYFSLTQNVAAQEPLKPAAPPQGAPVTAQSPAPTTASSNDKTFSSLADIIEDYTYDPANKRDPFMPFERPVASSVALGPLWPLQRFGLDQLRLVGVIWDVSNPKAMILDPAGKGYIVKVNERIGRNNGYIARIREGEIVVVESVTGVDGKLNYQTKLLKLQKE